MARHESCTITPVGIILDSVRLDSKITNRGVTFCLKGSIYILRIHAMHKANTALLDILVNN